MKVYYIKHKDITKLLNKLSEFTNTFEKFVMKHHNYSYDTQINLVNDIWECKIEIKDESNKFEVLKRITNKDRVL
jgi:hypothetical protein